MVAPGTGSPLTWTILSPINCNTINKNIVDNGRPLLPDQPCIGPSYRLMHSLCRFCCGTCESHHSRPGHSGCRVSRPETTNSGRPGNTREKCKVIVFPDSERLYV